MLGSKRAVLGGYRQESQNFFARLATQPTPQRKHQYDALIRPLVGAGVWANLDTLYILAASDATTALTNLISATYNATAVNSPTFTADRGYAGASTKYLDTGFNPSTAGGKYTQNSAAIFGWCLSTGAVDGNALGNAVAATTYLSQRETDDKLYMRLNAVGGASFNVACTDASGLIGATRTSSTAMQFYKHGASIGTGTNTSEALTNANFHILRALTFYDTRTVAAIGIGGQLSAEQHGTIYNALRTYLQAVAGIA